MSVGQLFSVSYSSGKGSFQNQIPAKLGTLSQRREGGLGFMTQMSQPLFRYFDKVKQSENIELSVPSLGGGREVWQVGTMSQV